MRRKLNPPPSDPDGSVETVAHHEASRSPSKSIRSVPNLSALGTATAGAKASSCTCFDTWMFLAASVWIGFVLFSMHRLIPMNYNTFSPIWQLKHASMGSCVSPETVSLSQNLPVNEFNFRTSVVSENGNWTNCDLLRSRLNIVLRNRYDLLDEYDRRDYTVLGKRLRAFKILMISVQKENRVCFENHSAGNSEYNDSIALFDKMKTFLFPWIRRNLIEFQESISGKGLIVCGGNYHIVYLKTMVYAIRYIINSSIPIDIIYAGEQDLSKENRIFLEKLAPDVRTQDLYDFIDGSMISIKGWDLKPFALLSARFEQVILMDADVLLILPPENIFQTEAYRSWNAAFFHDRTVTSPSHWDLLKLLKSLQPHPSSVACNLGSVTGFTQYEMESGFLALNKKRRFMGVLAAAKLLDSVEREIFYKYSGGDKETYWLGFEAVQDRYEFLPWYPGNIGTRESHWSFDFVCGRMLHFDEEGFPFWFNGGVRYADRRVMNYKTLPVIDPVSFDDGGLIGETVPLWTFSMSYACTTSSNRGVRNLPERLKRVVETSIAAYLYYENDGLGKFR